MIDPNVTTQASYPETNRLANVVLKALAGEDASIGYGQLACALTLARLSNTGQVLEDGVEIKYVEDLMEWTGAYFGQGGN